MKKLEWVLFRYLVRKIVRQGGHEVRVRTAYRIIHDEADKHFSEETWLTTDYFLNQQYQNQRCGFGEFDVSASIEQGKD